jgi:hypothetical protein
MILRIRVRLPAGSPLLQQLDRVSVSARLRQAAMLWAVNRCATLDVDPTKAHAYLKPKSVSDVTVDLRIHADEPAFGRLQQCSPRIRSAMAAAMAEVGLGSTQSLPERTPPTGASGSVRLDAAQLRDSAARVFEELGPLRFGNMDGT